MLERFQQEARVVAGLRHPNIVQIFDFDATDGHPHIVREYWLSGICRDGYASSCTAGVTGGLSRKPNELETIMGKFRVV